MVYFDTKAKIRFEVIKTSSNFLETNSRLGVYNNIRSVVEF